MQLKRIKVYGKLKQFLGKSTFEAAVKTPQQAVNFLRANFVGVDKHMNEQLYKIKIGGNSVNGDLLNISASGDIQIIPVAIGAKRAVKFVTNTLSSAASAVSSVASSAVNFVADNALSLGVTLATGGVGGVLSSLGTSLIIDGVSSLLGLGGGSSVSGASSVGDTDPAMRGSYNFNGIQNISSSGVPIPILYGLVFSGSIIVSSSVDTAQIVKEIS
jgi:predicted phage tail protein|tara:strand:+ start:677 stop:1324 length:648 start_codon:yes stop_codon:yes gene_type:complete